MQSGPDSDTKLAAPSASTSRASSSSASKGVSEVRVNPSSRNVKPFRRWIQVASMRCAVISRPSTRPLVKSDLWIGRELTT
jgi:hypothetical protein